MPRDGGISQSGWTGCRAESPPSPVESECGRTASKGQWEAHGLQHTEPLPATISTCCPPWRLPAPCLLHPPASLYCRHGRKMKQSKSRGVSGEMASESLEWLPLCQALQDKKPKQINKTKLKCPSSSVQLDAPFFMLPAAKPAFYFLPGQEGLPENSSLQSCLCP